MQVETALLHIFEELDYAKEEQSTLISDYRAYRTLKLQLENASVFIKKKNEDELVLAVGVLHFNSEQENLDPLDLIECLKLVSAYYLTFNTQCALLSLYDFWAVFDQTQITNEDFVVTNLGLTPLIYNKFSRQLSLEAQEQNNQFLLEQEKQSLLILQAKFKCAHLSNPSDLSNLFEKLLTLSCQIAKQISKKF